MTQKFDEWILSHVALITCINMRQHIVSEHGASYVAVMGFYQVFHHTITSLINTVTTIIPVCACDIYCNCAF